LEADKSIVRAANRTFVTYSGSDLALDLGRKPPIGRDRQLADPLSSRVEDCIGDSRRNAGDTDFADVLAAHRRKRIRNVEPNNVDVRDIGVKRQLGSPPSSEGMSGAFCCLAATARFGL